MKVTYTLISLGGGGGVSTDVVLIGTFTSRTHGLQGQVVALSESVLEVRNMKYDGGGSAAYFWADTAVTPLSGGYRLYDTAPNMGFGKQILPAADDDTFRFEFPQGQTIRDVVGGPIGV